MVKSKLECKLIIQVDHKLAKKKHFIFPLNVSYQSRQIFSYIYSFEGGVQIIYPWTIHDTK